MLFSSISMIVCWCGMPLNLVLKVFLEECQLIDKPKYQQVGTRVLTRSYHKSLPGQHGKIGSLRVSRRLVSCVYVGLGLHSRKPLACK